MKLYEYLVLNGVRYANMVKHITSYSIVSKEHLICLTCDVINGDSINVFDNSFNEINVSNDALNEEIENCEIKDLIL